MPNTDPQPYTAPPVKDRRTAPSGVLPKNAQAWVVTVIALLMVGVIALTGRNPTKDQRGSNPSPLPSAMDPSAARIEEYQKRIEEQARKLQLEQAQLAHTQQSLGLAPTSSPAGTMAMPSSPARSDFSTGEDSVEIERQKREYQSLFASNIALSYRKDASAAGQAPTALPPAEVLAKALALAGYAPPVASTTTTPATTREPTQPEPVGKARPQDAYDTFNHAEGKRYRLFEGTVIEAVLTNRLDGSFSGPVNCMVTTNVYSHSGQELLIPQGSRILGEVRKVETFGQQRLAVFFHRLITPDGFSLSLDQFHGLNQIGETGLVDLVNHHYLQVFGVSLAIGAIAGLSQSNTRYSLDESASDAYRQGVATSLSQSSMRILDRYLNVLPTFTIREGHRVKVYLSQDLLLPAYEKHQMPSDL